LLAAFAAPVGPRGALGRGRRHDPGERRCRRCGAVDARREAGLGGAQAPTGALWALRTMCRLRRLCPEPRHGGAWGPIATEAFAVGGGGVRVPAEDRPWERGLRAKGVRDQGRSHLRMARNMRRFLDWAKNQKKAGPKARKRIAKGERGGWISRAGRWSSTSRPGAPASRAAARSPAPAPARRRWRTPS